MEKFGCYTSKYVLTQYRRQSQRYAYRGKFSLNRDQIKYLVIIAC